MMTVLQCVVFLQLAVTTALYEEFKSSCIECALDNAGRLSSAFFSGVPERPRGERRQLYFAARPFGHAAKKFKSARFIQ
jgi:hypothetical protein